jgi:hypothetical protein
MWPTSSGRFQRTRPDLQLGPLIETLDPRDNDDWDPDQAK